MSDAQHATWTIASQSPRSRVDAGGVVQEGYDVTFTTGDGNTGTVFVPGSRYTVDNVRQAVTELADRLDTIGALTS